MDHWSWFARQLAPALGSNHYCDFSKARTILKTIKAKIRNRTAGGMDGGGAGADTGAD